jgi:ubiquinone/menaquinone biosynthesis C-methylase UbiE
MKPDNYWATNKKVNEYLGRMKISEDTTPQVLRALVSLVFDETKYNLENSLFIDMGCGPGNISAEFIKEFGFKEFVAIDKSEAMLDAVPFYVDIEKVRTSFQRADVGRSILKAKDISADMVLSCRTLFYVENINHVLQEVGRVLKPGGVFAFSTLVHKQDNLESIFCENAGFYMNAFAHSYKNIIRLLRNYDIVPIGALHGSPELDFTKIPVNNAACLFQKR